MAHVMFAFYGHPGAHEKLKTEINNWRYEHEGELRMGTTAPILSEVKFYDVRLPKESVDSFLRDLGMGFTQPPKDLVIRNPHPAKLKSRFFTGMLNLGISLLRKIFFLKNGRKASGEKKFKLTASWYYAYLIGVLPDEEQIDPVLKTKREIL